MRNLHVLKSLKVLFIFVGFVCVYTDVHSTYLKKIHLAVLSVCHIG